MSDALHTLAAELLTAGRAKMVLGLRRREGGLVPAFVTNPARADALEPPTGVEANLAAYLNKPAIRKQFPVAIVVDRPALRSLLVLASEHQLPEASVTALLVDAGQCVGAMDLAEAAAWLAEHGPALIEPDPALEARRAELAAMSSQQRAEFWRQQFARCTRCYACRAACPSCYCTQCIVERNTPQWISPSARGHGNYAWNLIRAFHLAGRCSACGSCQRACPQGIPLMLLNAEALAVVQEEFVYAAGTAADAEPFIGTWNEDDAGEFIR